jgi:hypothetical protein
MQSAGMPHREEEDVAGSLGGYMKGAEVLLVWV